MKELSLNVRIGLHCQMQGDIPLNERYPSRRKHTRDDCLARIPYASVMAFVMCAVGVILFAVMMAWAFNASIEQTRRSLNIDRLPFLSKIHIFFLTVAVAMGLIAIVLLTIGAMSTGATRNEFFRGVEGRMGGRCANVIAMIFGYFSHLCWLFAFAGTAILCFVYYIFDQLCRPITGFSDTSCLDFTIFESLVNKVSSESLKLCGGDLQQFCALTSTAYVWYIVGFIGCLITVLGLLHFLMCSAANYSHVSFGIKAEELRELVVSNDMEALNAITRKGFYAEPECRVTASRQMNYYGR